MTQDPNEAIRRFQLEMDKFSANSKDKKYIVSYPILATITYTISADSEEEAIEKVKKCGVSEGELFVDEKRYNKLEVKMVDEELSSSMKILMSQMDVFPENPINFLRVYFGGVELEVQEKIVSYYLQTHKNPLLRPDIYEQSNSKLQFELERMSRYYSKSKIDNILMMMSSTI